VSKVQVNFSAISYYPDFLMETGNCMINLKRASITLNSLKNLAAKSNVVERANDSRLSMTNLKECRSPKTSFTVSSAIHTRVL